jgi:RND family efflux transporter MFP subunit
MSATPAAEFDCVIQPRQVLEIRSPIEGLIDRITVERGDRVRKGQELAYVDTSVERVLAESARYRSETEGAIRAARSKIELSSRKYKRAQDLVNQNFVAQQALDEARNEMKLADAEMQDALDNRKLAEIEHRRQLATIALKTIRSPINGVVMERILSPGELVESGVGRKPIFKLAETDVLWVEALLPADAYRQVKIGMPAEVKPAIQAERKYSAKVAIIDRVLDPASGTFGLRLEMRNPKGAVLAGVRCKVDFESLSVPAPPRSTDSSRDSEPRGQRPAPASRPDSGAPLPR